MNFLRLILSFLVLVALFAGCSDKVDNDPIEVEKPAGDKPAPEPGEEPELGEEGP